VLFLENKREFSMGLSDDEGSPGQGAATAKAKGVSRCDGAMGKVGGGTVAVLGEVVPRTLERTERFLLMLLWCFGTVVWCGAFMGGGNGALGTGDIM